jgi:parvulin-like peptidyl-prolyl isomerase
MRRSRLFLLVPVVLAALALASCQVGDDPAAVVGSSEISSARLQADVPLYEFLSGLSGAPCGSPQGTETARAACTRFTLANDIREEIVKEYAARHDLSVAAQDVTSAVDQVTQNVGGGDALAQQLEQHGLVRADLVALARRLLLFNQVQRAVTDERVTDQQLQDLYDQSVAQFTTVDVRHILVKTRAQARTVAARATDANFAQLAARFSTDDQSAQNGGDLGTYSQAQFEQQFDPTFVRAALSLQPGEISGPVKTRFGWHVIELVRSDTASFQDVRDQLVAQQGTQVFDTWLVERLGALDVEVNPRFGRLDPDTGDVVPVRSTAADGTTAISTTPSSSPSA